MSSGSTIGPKHRRKRIEVSPGTGFLGAVRGRDARREVASLIRKSKVTLLSRGTDNSAPRTTVLVENERPEIRVEKVLEIRRQLGEGRYSIADRLDVVIERIIADLS